VRDATLVLPGFQPARLRVRGRSDAALVRAASRGDEQALAALFRRHWPAAHRAAWLVLHDERAAEDVAQEAFVAAVARLDTFDRARPFAPWLHRIVVNRAIDHARARAARREVASEHFSEPAAAPERRERVDEELLAALARLSEDQRAVVVLRHLLGYRPAEVARMLGLPAGTVNSRLRRALDTLARELDR
jgi:RNA polymerase sigma-70 factor (ECF subfamily)